MKYCKLIKQECDFIRCLYQEEKEQHGYSATDRRGISWNAEAHLLRQSSIGSPRNSQALTGRTPEGKAFCWRN